MPGKRRVTKFDRCLKAVKKSGSAASPGAVCQKTVGRGNPPKFGAIDAAGKQLAKRLNKGHRRRKMTDAQKKAFVKRMAAARGGKRGKRKNPAEAAIETSKDFHGYDSGSVTTFITPIKYHANLAGLARLEYLKVKGPRGLVTLSGFGKEAMLTRNEKKSGDKHPQLFITGGDQAVDLSAFGISRPHEIEVLGPVVNVGYYTEKKHLIEKDGGEGLYDHKFGYTMNSRGQHVPVKNAKLPILIYDVRNKLLGFAGGGYTIPSEGIDG